MEIRLLARNQRFAGWSSYLLRLLWPRLCPLRERISPTPSSYQVELHHNYFENRAAWADFLIALDGLFSLAERRGLCSVVFLHTSLTELSWLHPELDIYQRVAQAARQRGLWVVESFPSFRGRPASTLWVGPLDPHPNRRANEILARALLEGLEALPPACWELRAGCRGPPAEPPEPAKPAGSTAPRPGGTHDPGR